MQIIMEPGTDGANVQRICDRLVAGGSSAFVRNGRKGKSVVINTPSASWSTIVAVQGMPGVTRVRKSGSDIDDTNIAEIIRIEPPSSYRKDLPAGEHQKRVVRSSRDEIRAILEGRDPRFMLVVGPCSIHDTVAGFQYALRLATLAKRVQDKILLVMRVYFEKPRTTVGWEGLIQDPHLDQSFDMPAGLTRARSFLLRVLGLGLATATEFVDPITPQYIADLVSWGAIGARSAEAQAYRRMASGLSMPVGFKNGTGGSVQLAVNGVVAARASHPFLGVDLDGRVAQIKTLGNPDCFIVLRGSSRGPNYDEQSVREAVSLLEKAGVCPRLMVDCSHDNSQKNHELQRVVLEEIMRQRHGGNSGIVGAMLESNLHEGNQPLGGLEFLQHGVSITDACIGWPETEELILEAYQKL